MCGRFVLASPLSLIAETFSVGMTGVGVDLRPRYNIAPGQDVVAVVFEGENRLTQFRWGLVPSWAKDPSIGARMINARAETVAEKPSFRAAFEKRRCLIAADGFYEWRREGQRKIPVYICRKSRKPFGFAGLYETWTSPEGREVRTCTIITTEANELLRRVHDRMPVILPPESQALWLDPAMKDKPRLLALLGPYPADRMTAHDVSPRVNSPLHDDPENIRPVN